MHGADAYWLAAHAHGLCGDDYGTRSAALMRIAELLKPEPGKPTNEIHAEAKIWGADGMYLYVRMPDGTEYAGRAVDELYNPKSGEYANNDHRNRDAIRAAVRSALARAVMQNVFARPA
jgi:hypothetical protein